MWHDGVSGRGANEIASCLYHFLNSVTAPEIKHIIFYSDTCGGQNKNSILAAMFVYTLRHHPILESVDHKFLIPGHKHMECDNDHALIEKKKNCFISNSSTKRLVSAGPHGKIKKSIFSCGYALRNDVFI